MPHYVIFERGQLCMVRVLDPPLLDLMIRQQNRARAEVERDHKQKRLLENVTRARKRKEREMWRKKQLATREEEEESTKEETD
jgi:hypothetical protein